MSSFPAATTVARLRPRLPRKEQLWVYSREHGFILLLYALLTAAVSWPTVLNFSTRMVSSGGDARHNLWILWHYKEALLGREPFFSTNLLYYPEGASLLTHGLGPVTSLFALPFWRWGPWAAHNGAVLVSLWLTGYFMYLLARGLGLGRREAFFAGLILLMAPMHLAGLWGHMTKVFLGFIPLAFLSLHFGLDVARSRWWMPATALVLLAALLHSGYVFVYTALGVAFFVAVALLTAVPEKRRELLQRTFFLAVSGVIIVGPLLLAIIKTGQDPRIKVDLITNALGSQPDLLEFLLPPTFSRFFGQAGADFLAAFGIKPTIETAVSLALTGLLLSFLAFFKGRPEARWWVCLTVISAILALGPALELFGYSEFTEYQLPIMLPFAILSKLPGLEFMRVSGRFMMLGYVAFAISAAYGLGWLNGRFPGRAWPLTFLATGLLLLETWPGPWLHETPRPVSEFYHQLAADEEMYGVLDLPVHLDTGAWSSYASLYQMDQLVHRKGIASGYLSRTYSEHPVFPCLIPDPLSWPDIQVDDRPSSCADNTLYQLADLNYRYVIWHKPIGMPSYSPDPADVEATSAYVLELFAEQEPVWEDDWLIAFAVPPIETTAPTLKPTIRMLDNWYSYEAESHRWARSPATLLIFLPQPGEVWLEMTPGTMYTAAPEQPVGHEGRLTVETETGFTTAVAIRNGEIVRIPLSLPAGHHVVTLSLEAGNFRPSDISDSKDSRWLSFSTSRINLKLAP